MTVAEAVTLIGAITAAIVSIASALGTLRQGTKLDQVHSLVNGQSVRMEILAERTGRAEGHNAAVGELPTKVSGISPLPRPGSGESI